MPGRRFSSVLFCLFVYLVGFSRSSVTCGMWLTNKPTSDTSTVTKGRVSHGAHIIKYWTISSMANKCNIKITMIIGLKLRLFIYPLNVGKLSLLVVFTMIIFTINMQKMAKELSFTWSWSQFTLLREINAIFKNSRLIKRLFARRYLSGALISVTLSFVFSNKWN